MLKHLVLMKFKDTVTQDDIEDLKKLFLSLPPIIKEIQSYEYGSDSRSNRTFDFALVSTFADFAALERYRIHPDHVAVGTKVRSLSAKLDIVDFEY